MDDVAGNATYDIVKWILGILLLIVFATLPYWLKFLSTEFSVTGRMIVVAIVLVLGIVVFQQLLTVRQRRVFTKKHEQIAKEMLAERDQQIVNLEGQLANTKKLIEQFYENKENSILSRNFLMSKYGLAIVSAKYGLETKATEDVTERVILELEENGKIFVDNELVGGDNNDPVKRVRKYLYVDYIQSKPLSKSILERNSLSIEDLVPSYTKLASLPSQPRVNTDLRLRDVFKLDEREFIEDSTPQKLIIHLINRGNDIIRIKEVRLSLYTVDGLTASDVSSEYRVGKKGRLIIPFDSTKAEMLPGKKFSIVINLAKRWYSRDITQLFGNLANFYIDLVYKDELIEDEYVSF